MRSFKRFIFPLFKSILFILFVFKGSEAIFREVFYPAAKYLSNTWFDYLLALDFGRLFSRLIFFIWTGVLYIFIELLLSKHKLYQTVVFQAKHKVKNFFKGGFWGSVFAFVLLLFLLLFKKVEFVGSEPNGWKIILGTLFSIISVFLVTFSLELIFRGFVLNYLSKSLNAHVSILISSVLYGSVFVQKVAPYYPVMQLLSGILLGYLFVFYGFYYSFGAHFAWRFFEAFFLNGSAIYMLAYPVFKKDGISVSSENFFGSILAFLVLSIFFIIFRKKLFSKPYLS